jgi:dTDP-4-amino-4,6-dideoxygalactose transaminase
VERAGRRSNWQSYPLRMRDGATVTQIDAIQGLVDRGIAAKRGIPNAHQEPAYAGKDNWSRAAGETLQVSERLRDRTVLIPLFHGMTSDEQDDVIAALREIGS